MATLCIYLFSFLISVSANPLGQLVQPCNFYQPTSYSSPTSIPVAVHQPSSSNTYPQAPTVQVPATYPGPLGETLNQIVLSRIISNPSLQKIIDPNTKLYNQNGDEVHRQVTNTGSPNVINNYFIVPPEFFNLNETIARNEENVDPIDQVKRPRRRKLKRRLKKVKQSSGEDDEVVVTKPRKARRKLNKAKRKRIDEIESDELIELDESQEVVTVKNQEREVTPKRPRKKKRNKIIPPPSIEDESNEDEFYQIEEIKKPRKSRPKPRSKVIDDESYDVIPEVPKPEFFKEKTIPLDKVKELESTTEIPKAKKSNKSQRQESSIKSSEDNVLKNIELPTDILTRAPAENRPTRDSKRNATKKVSEPESTNIRKMEPLTNMTPFSDDVLKNFFPYMPMGNYNNPDANYPSNFNHYYQYLDPVRNSNANRNKKKNKSQSRTNNNAKSNTHTIEIKLKPKKKESTTETPVTTEEPKDVQEVLVSIEVDQSTESIEQITVIPMEMPYKVSPIVKDEESSSRESYETFSKLEDLHDFIMPELGTEDEVHLMSNNGIINDYYPTFDDDVDYSHDFETVNNIDHRYFYETGNEDNVNKETRKMDRYEDSRSPKRDIDITDLKTKKLDKDINKFDHNEYLDHISKFSNIDSAEHEILKSTDDIRRVKVPSKNTRVKTENVETVFAGSKVAKYGVTLNKEADDSYSIHTDDSSSSEAPEYVVAKSLGRPEDYW